MGGVTACACMFYAGQIDCALSRRMCCWQTNTRNLSLPVAAARVIVTVVMCCLQGMQKLMVHS